MYICLMEDIMVAVTLRAGTNETQEVHVSYAPEEVKLTIVEMARILAGGLALCVRLTNDEGIKKDHELMREVIDYLNNEFVSLESFQDAQIIKNKKKNG